MKRTGRGRVKPRQAALGQDIPGGLGVFGQPHKSTTRPSAALTKGTWGLRPQRLLHELPRPSRDVDSCPCGPGCSICASRAPLPQHGGFCSDSHAAEKAPAVLIYPPTRRPLASLTLRDARYSSNIAAAGHRPSHSIQREKRPSEEGTAPPCTIHGFSGTRRFEGFDRQSEETVATGASSDPSGKSGRSVSGTWGLVCARRGGRGTG